MNPSSLVLNRTESNVKIRIGGINMKKTILSILCALLIAIFPAVVCASGAAFADSFPLSKNDSGIETVIVQRRLYDLGYIHFRPTGKYADMTVSAIRTFQSRNGLSVTGKLTYDGYIKLFTSDIKRAGANGEIPRIFGKGQIVTTESGSLYDWYKIVEPAFPVGAQATITDYNTGLTYTVERTGGTNHADVQPVNQASFNNLYSSFGNGISWEKRAVIVEIGDMRIAASIFGYPNKNDVLKNGLSKGSYCLYFSGSKSDIGAGLIDTEHEAKCRTANGQ